MAEEDKKKKSKKPRKQRKDKGTKRKPTYIGAYRDKEGRPTSKMEVLASGSSGLTGAKLGKSTRLAGVINSMKLPQMDNILSIQQELKKQQEDLKKQQEEFQKYFNKPSVEIVPKADVKQAQEEPSQQEVIASNKLKEFALKSNIKNRRKEIEQLKQQKEEETRLAQEAVERANEAESELRQMKEISDEMFQEVERKKQEAEALTTQMRQQKIQSIFDKANAMTLSTLRSIVGDIPGGDITDYRATYLGSQGIEQFNLRKKGKAYIFEPKEGVYEGQVFIPSDDITKLEQERAQMEDQIGGLHDTVRELMMQREDAYASNLVNESILGAISDLQMEGYERKVQEARASEEEAYEIALSNQEKLAQKEQEYQQLLGQAEEEYGGLKAQMEREGLTAKEQRMGLEAEIRQLKEARDAEIQQGLAVKNAETERLQKEKDDLQSQMERLQADIEQSKAQIKQWSESSILKREHESQIKELNRQIKDKESRIEGYKDYIEKKLTASEKEVSKQESEIIKLREQAQKAQEATSSNINFQEQLEQERGRFEEELLSLQEKVIRQERQKEGLLQTNQQLMEAGLFEEQEKIKAQRQGAFEYLRGMAEKQKLLQRNEVLGMMGEDLAQQQLRNIRATDAFNRRTQLYQTEFKLRMMAQDQIDELEQTQKNMRRDKEQILQTIREATLAQEQDRLRQEREFAVQLDLARQQGKAEQTKQFILQDIRKEGTKMTKKYQDEEERLERLRKEKSIDEAFKQKREEQIKNLQELSDKELSKKIKFYRDSANLEMITALNEESRRRKKVIKASKMTDDEFRRKIEEPNLDPIYVDEAWRRYEIEKEREIAQGGGSTGQWERGKRPPPPPRKKSEKFLFAPPERLNYYQRLQREQMAEAQPDPYVDIPVEVPEQPRKIAKPPPVRKIKVKEPLPKPPMLRQEEMPLTESNLAPLSIPAELRRGISDQSNMSPVSFASDISAWNESDERDMQSMMRARPRPRPPRRAQPDIPVQVELQSTNELQNPLMADVRQAQEEVPEILFQTTIGVASDLTRGNQ